MSTSPSGGTGVAERSSFGLPRGRRIELPFRGTTFVREMEGPLGAPTVLLLHGWCASAGLNWFRVFGPLAQSYRIVAPDLRGHGRGLRSRKLFRLTDCADDCAALLEVLGTGPVIAVGYSMGGPVSQLLWRRHRDLVAGLVQCATAPSFLFGGRERVVFTTMMTGLVGTTRMGTGLARLGAGLPGLTGALPPPSSWPVWATTEFRRHDLRVLVEAGHSIGTYSAQRWISEIDVPTAVVVTERDRAVPPPAQLAMARAIAGATVHTIDDGHAVCGWDTFAPPLLDAVDSVARRIAAGSAARPATQPRSS